MAQPRAHQILVRGDAEHACEQPQEMERADAGLIGGIINRQQLATLDVLYANYLAAGAACLTARGYQVQMNVPVQ